MVCLKVSSPNKIPYLGNQPLFRYQRKGFFDSEHFLFIICSEICLDRWRRDLKINHLLSSQPPFQNVQAICLDILTKTTYFSNLSGEGSRNIERTGFEPRKSVWHWLLTLWTKINRGYMLPMGILCMKFCKFEAKGSKIYWTERTKIV